MPYRKGMIRQHGSELSVFHRMLDAAIILTALWVSAKGYGVSPDLHYQLAGAVAVLGFLFFAEWHTLYSSWRADSVGREMWVLMSIWILVCCVLLALAFISKSSVHFSRVTILAWWATTPILLVTERLLLRVVLRRFRKLGLNTRSVAIVGGGKAVTQIADAIMNSPWMGLSIKGIYDDADAPQREQAANLLPRDLKTLLQQVHEGQIDCVYIAYPMHQEEKISHLVDMLADSTVSVHIVPDVFVSELFHARWSSLGGMPVVSVFESPIYGSNAFLKRLEDVVMGSLILLLISPVMLSIALAVKLTSPGPAIFKQRRYGLDGKVIEVWKFRSMSVLEDGPNIPQAQKNDPRITPLGAFLRRTSLDELPQFINVLQGRMSIVGPRPHAVAHNEQYRKLIHGYMLRHTVKPGITGWAQVNGWRGETDTMEKMEMRVRYDLEYINNWSIIFDLKIIWMTIFGGMRGKNAY
ncbi:UDP-glucose:undecaprenyl-phosphate glucose-1-phosphate transferase [Sideroxyarcus emersonii]|uniref:UDP-glucose:undecaprenyl-phosphate glucose-1-phosphate transferase n=1 Tax=Sideroxyarcus emersonii TaxID=2764705 RepID=A0AAN2C0M2_9PROT|nr:undecaprenyl-phosphate glucose phosphotransferase [Sideroxyarcus emersonii]BCK88807.1 UDP-glucose:undecaprenyl-phosphate glucose-1-phosphate transferase [Sideroxyarcus emersonii]